MYTGQSSAIARERPLWASLRRLSECPTGQSGAHRTSTVHCPVRHQGAGWLPTSWISSLILWASFVLESWTSKLFLCLHWGIASSVPWSNPLRILWATDKNTSKYISPQVMLIIKHQNLLSQMTRGPFSYSYKPPPQVKSRYPGGGLLWRVRCDLGVVSQSTVGTNEIVILVQFSMIS
jgi:hypothetical protein